MTFTDLQAFLPEGTEVMVFESEHPWLHKGMTGKIHWNHPGAVLPTFMDEKTSVQLVAPRDRILRYAEDCTECGARIYRSKTRELGHLNGCPLGGWE